MGCSPHPKAWRADDLREAEALDVAAAIRQAVAEGWARLRRQDRLLAAGSME